VSYERIGSLFKYSYTTYRECVFSITFLQSMFSEELGSAKLKNAHDFLTPEKLSVKGERNSFRFHVSIKFLGISVVCRYKMGAFDAHLIRTLVLTLKQVNHSMLRSSHSHKVRVDTIFVCYHERNSSLVFL